MMIIYLQLLLCLQVMLSQYSLHVKVDEIQNVRTPQSAEMLESQLKKLSLQVR